MKGKIFIRTFLVVGSFLLFAWIQFSGPYLAGEDPYYHVAMASLYSKEGLISSFPWTQVSIQKEGVNDRHFLYHILMIPFLWKNPIQGGKAYCVLNATVCIAVFVFVLESFAVRHPWFWVLVLFSTGSFFWYRFSVVRPQVVAVTFGLLAFWTICKERSKLVFLVSLLAFLFYSSANLAPFIALTYALAVYLKEKRFCLKPALASVLGFVAGVFLHPHFPTIVRTWFIQNFSVLYHSLASTPGLNLGAELAPPAADTIIKALPIPLFIILGTTFWALSANTALSKESLTAFLSTCAFLTLTCLSKRFIEYAAPFSVLLASLSYRDTQPSLAKSFPKLLGPLSLAFVLVTGAASAKALWQTREVIANVGSPRLKTASHWLLSNAKKGEIVFTCDWDDFPQLFFFNRQNYYLVGLDPTFFYAYDREKFRIWNQIRSGAQKSISRVIMRKFNAKYFLATPEFKAAIANARQDPGLELVYSDSACVIFKVRGS